MHKKYLFRELTPGSGSNCIEGVHFIEPPSRELRYIPKGAMKGLGVDVIGLNRLVKLLKQSNNDQKPGIHFELSEVTFDQDRTIAALHYKGLGFSRGVAVFSRTADSWQLDQTRTLSCTALPNRYVNAVQLTQEQIDVYRGFLSHYRCSEAPGCGKEDQLLLDMAWGFPPNPKSDDRASHCLAGIELQPSTGSHTYIMGPEVVRGLGFSLVRTEPLRDSRNVQRPGLYYQLSGIAFDKSHQFAVLYYSVGSEGGYTAILERKGSEWVLSPLLLKRSNDCQGVIS